MKKQGKTIIVGLLALCVLGGAYVGINYTKEQSAAKTQAAEDAARTYLTDMGDVTYFSYDNDGATLEFEKEGDTWYYAPDHSVNLIQGTLESMAADVKKIEITRTLEGGGGLEEYGLTEPANRITVKDAAGSTQTVLIGNAAGDDIYACLDGQETVTVIGAELQTMTEKTLEDLTEAETEAESETTAEAEESVDTAAGEATSGTEAAEAEAEYLSETAGSESTEAITD